ncbi:hypothetical protein A4A49_56276, partial [Nicotiana attenuata]
SSLALSSSSLHQLITICSIKLKPSNYLVWRTQILQLMQTLKVTTVIKEEAPPESIENEKGEHEFQLKQQLQTVTLGTKSIDEYIKEFKGICDSLTAIHKPLDEDKKVINFARGLGSKYKTFCTVMLGKPPYPTFNQFVNALRGFEMREDIDEQVQQSNLESTVAFVAQKSQGRGRGNFYRGRGNQRGGGNKGFNQRQFNTPQWDYSYQAQQEVPQALAAMSLGDQLDNNLYVDSGATNHMVQSTGNLTNSSPFKGTNLIMVGNGDRLPITHIGDKYIGKYLNLQDVFVVPKLKKNLISVSKFVKDNACSIEFTDDDFVIKDKITRTILAKGDKRHDLYTLDGDLHEALMVTKTAKNSDTIWHQRLGHPHSRIINPDYNTLKVFGCRCFPYLKGHNKNKFQPKTFPCVFIGYSLLHKGYRCYHAQSRKVFISRRVIFDNLPY